MPTMLDNIRDLQRAAQELEELTERVQRQVAALNEGRNVPPAPCDVRPGVLNALEAELLVALDRMIYAHEHTFTPQDFAFAKGASARAHAIINARMEEGKSC